MAPIESIGTAFQNGSRDGLQNRVSGCHDMDDDSTGSGIDSVSILHHQHLILKELVYGVDPVVFLSVATQALSSSSVVGTEVMDTISKGTGPEVAVKQQLQPNADILEQLNGMSLNERRSGTTTPRIVLTEEALQGPSLQDQCPVKMEQSDQSCPRFLTVPKMQAVGKERRPPLNGGLLMNSV